MSSSSDFDDGVELILPVQHDDEDDRVPLTAGGRRLPLQSVHITPAMVAGLAESGSRTLPACEELLGHHPIEDTGPLAMYPPPGAVVDDAPKSGWDADSLDYHRVQPQKNVLWDAETKQVDVVELARRDRWVRWCWTFVIGVCIGVAAFGIAALTDRVFNPLRLAATVSVLDATDNSFFAPLFVNIAVAVLYAVVSAALVVYVAPTAAGPGIPEVKGYLNGIVIPGFLRFRTLAIKYFGIILTVSAGFPLGKEGPLIHTGAAISAGLSQGLSRWFSWYNVPFLARFRNDQDKRDFCTFGAAAGIAAAFGAPIGGVAFALEEGASFFTVETIWLTFFCCMVTVFTTDFLLSGLAGVWGSMTYAGLLNLGDFGDYGWYAQQLPIFVLIGAGGGLIGGVMMYLTTEMVLLRRRYVPLRAKGRKVAEAAAVALLCVAVAYTSSVFLTVCSPFNPSAGDALPTFNCHGQQSQMAYLLFVSNEDAMHTLLHSPYDLSYAVLVIFCVLYALLMLASFGVANPGGLFIPGLLLGSAYGRLVGQLLHAAFPHAVQPSVVALMGAAAVLGGIHRMTFSLTVLMVEATGSMTFSIPIMITLWCSKFVGDCFNHGLYDTMCHLKRVPILDWEPPVQLRHYHAVQVMHRPVVTLRCHDTVANIAATLQLTKHNGYPVVDERGRLAGLVLRSQLLSVLHYRAFTADSPAIAAHTRFGQFYRHYPHPPPARLVFAALTDDDFARRVDLGLFANPVPTSVRRACPLNRVFHTFRNLGLRHLVVVDADNKPVGMITRHDLVNLDARRDLHVLRADRPSVFSKEFSLDSINDS